MLPENVGWMYICAICVNIESQYCVRREMVASQLGKYFTPSNTHMGTKLPKRNNGNEYKMGLS